LESDARLVEDGGESPFRPFSSTFACSVHDSIQDRIEILWALFPMHWYEKRIERPFGQLTKLWEIVYVRFFPFRCLYRYIFMHRSGWGTGGAARTARSSNMIQDKGPVFKRGRAILRLGVPASEYTYLREDEMIRRAVDALLRDPGPVEATRVLTLPQRRKTDSVIRHRLDSRPPRSKPDLGGLKSASLLHREPHGERGPLSHLALDVDPAAVLVDNVAADVQPKPQALLLGGVKGLKEAT